MGHTIPAGYRAGQNCRSAAFGAGPRRRHTRLWALLSFLMYSHILLTHTIAPRHSILPTVPQGATAPQLEVARPLKSLCHSWSFISRETEAKTGKGTCPRAQS